MIKNLINKFKSLQPHQKLIPAIILYIIVFSYFTSMRYLSGVKGDPDYGTFEQSMYSTAYHGKVLYNTYEERSHFRFRNKNESKIDTLDKLKTIDGSSHMGVHNSLIFLLLTPLYAPFKNLIPMIILQTIVIAFGAWAVFLIAGHILDKRTGLYFGLLYLLYFPIHGINFDSFHELGFVITPVLFSFYFLLKRKYVPFWIMIILAIICKEDIPFLIASYGLFVIYIAWQMKKGKWGVMQVAGQNCRSGFLTAINGERTREDGSQKSEVAGKDVPIPTNAGQKRDSLILGLNGVALVVLGITWLLLSLYIIIPAFRGIDYHFFGERYAEFGDSFSEVVKNMILKPHLVLMNLLKIPKFTFFLEIVAPLAFMSFFCLPAFLVSLPNLVINLLSSFSVMYNTGSRYPAPIVPFCFISAVLGFHYFLSKAKTEEHRKTRYFRTMKIAFFISIVGALFFNPSPLRIGWKVPRVTDHRRTSWKIIKQIPKEASLSTQVDLFLYTNRRLKGYVGYKEGVEYILVDVGEKGKIEVDQEGNNLLIKYRDKEDSIVIPDPCAKDWKTIDYDRRIRNKWFSEGSDWDIEIPRLMREGKYKIIKQEDGIVLLKRNSK
ncbi:MAG: DUF2079 domain-containing protein [Candidatus Eremiobacteraeota bacterium]|nr:DUF2079 domain-containing protein [Candidatus Eremiobacteraeota bacterium]